MSTIEIIYNYNENNSLLISAWQQGSGEGNSDQHIAMSKSYDYGQSWTQEVTIIKDTQYPTWGPALYYHYKSKLLYCFYSRSGEFNFRSPPNRYYPGGDVLYTSSSDYGITWNNSTLIWKFYGSQYNISKVTANKPISIFLSNNIERWILPIWQEYRTSNMTGNYESRNLISDNYGKTWNIYGNIQCGEFDHGKIPTYCIEPSIAYFGNNTVLGFYRAEDGFIYESFSYNNGINWTKPDGNHEILNSDSKIFVFTDSNNNQILAHNPIPGIRTPLTLMINNDNEKWKEYVVLDETTNHTDLSYPTSVEVVNDNNKFVYTSYTYSGQGIRLAVVRLTD